MPGITYPRVPGHEVAGVIDEVGPGVTQWKKGQRVGVGWHGGQDGTCLACRRGDFVNCANAESLRDQLRRRLSGIHGRAGGSAGADAGIARCCRSRAADVRRHHHVQRSCATAGRCRATWLRCRESAGLGIWEFSSRRSSVIASRRSGAGRKTPRWRKNSARTFTSIAPRPMPRPNCRNLAARA